MRLYTDIAILLQGSPSRIGAFNRNLQANVLVETEIIIINTMNNAFAFP